MDTLTAAASGPAVVSPEELPGQRYPVGGYGPPPATAISWREDRAQALNRGVTENAQASTTGSSAVAVGYGSYDSLADMFRQIGCDEGVHKEISLARMGGST
jgi:hypothetical protein